jgi:hypothetical protein
MAPKVLSVKCPVEFCKCGGTQTVTVKPGKDRRTGKLTLTYSPCEALKAQGWTGNVSLVAWA